MGVFDGRAPEAEPVVKRFRRALKASGAKLTIKQIAYGTWRAMASDDPSQATQLNALIDAEGLTTGDKSAVDSILNSAEV